MFCYFLFSKRHFVLRASSSDDLLVGESHPDSYLYLYLSFCVYSTNNAKDCKYIYVCGNIPSCFAPLDDRGDRTNHMKSASLVGWQGKLGSYIQPTNVLKPEPIHATFSINKF